MSWSEMHLATEAMAALVDNELSGGAAARARLHLSRCGECAAAVAAQAEAKTALFGSAGPMLPATLLSRLVDIPFTAEMAPGMNDGVMALHGGSLMFGSAPQLTQLPAPAPLHEPPPSTRTTGSRRDAFRLR
ncbi:MAG: zf-HC2 domain-containing protein [Geodermatophilaceae bacterium]|nr:zf-HC2 domain-containing protein [Geodermatophilaceae bacterium]MDQ3475425.1 zf-HC2 domain-containing protein [Actinomycetota bacterium]